MRKLIMTGLATCSIMATAMAQTLFTFGNNPVSKDEFLRVYQKNSMNKKPDFSEPALREYLDLYSLFRMKVKEAELQMLDTMPSIQSELNNYRKQLAKNYLTDEEVTNRLMHEAYDRMKEEVHVAHILILSSQTAEAADTVEKYRRIDSIYNAVIKKNADFGQLAKQYSDDRGSKATGGDIGFITALQTVYPFENAVYSTPIGKVSKPFKTQFGYHIVKVIEKRPARGEIKVAQVLITTPESKGDEGVALAKRRLDSVQNDLKANIAFEDVVKKYSDDKFSINDGGVMPTFGVGKWAPDFENAAYGLKNPGDISQPVKTNYGYHVIKLIQKYPLKPFDSLRTVIKKKVDNDSRSSVAHEIYMNKVKQKNGFKEYPANLDAIGDAFSKIPDTGKNANTFKAADYKYMNEPLFTLAGKTYVQSDLISYAEGLTRGRIMGPKKAVVRDIYKMYSANIVNDLQEHMLVEEKPEFKNLMEEYRDGIMLFELMDRNVWGKASKDTTGLKSFYETRKGKYLWEPGFTGAVYRFKNDAAMKEGMKLLNKKGGIKDEELVKKVNKDTIPDAVTIQRGRYEFAKYTDFPQSALVQGKVTEAKKNTDGSYTAVKVDELYTQPVPKSLDDARGYAIAEYQDYLEKQWNEQMRQKYAMKLDDNVFKSIVK